MASIEKIPNNRIPAPGWIGGFSSSNPAFAYPNPNLKSLPMLGNMDNIPRDKVGLGSTVKVYDNSKNEEMEYKLVTSEESDFPSGKISTSSPIGRALLNKKVGDTAIVVTPNGKREMEILKLSTIHDEAAAG